jgi:hypothetical protein
MLLLQGISWSSSNYRKDNLVKIGPLWLKEGRMIKTRGRPQANLELLRLTQSLILPMLPHLYMRVESKQIMGHHRVSHLQLSGLPIKQLFLKSKEKNQFLPKEILQKPWKKRDILLKPKNLNMRVQLRLSPKYHMVRLHQILRLLQNKFN